MNSRSIERAFVSVEEDASGWLVSFSDQEFNARAYLTVQREKSPTQQDIALGIDGYHVDIDDQTHTGFGGILRFELHADRAFIEFESDDPAVTAPGATIEITFSLRERQLNQLSGCLTKIFESSECFQDLTG
ncbi:MAG: Imm10 family immunity protein [Burkholderiales bacterium]